MQQLKVKSSIRDIKGRNTFVVEDVARAIGVTKCEYKVAMRRKLLTEERIDLREPVETR